MNKSISLLFIKFLILEGIKNNFFHLFAGSVPQLILQNLLNLNLNFSKLDNHG